MPPRNAGRSALQGETPREDLHCLEQRFQHRVAEFLERRLSGRAQHLLLPGRGRREDGLGVVARLPERKHVDRHYTRRERITRGIAGGGGGEELRRALPNDFFTGLGERVGPRLRELALCG